MTIAAAELSHFAQYASSWWDPDGPFKTLHRLNPLRLSYIQTHARLRGVAALDIGCGGGLLSEALAAQGAIVTGLDLVQASLDCAREHASISIDYVLCDAEHWVESHAAQYAVVACMELLEHVADPAALIHAAARLLKPGGKLFFSTLNRTPQAFLGAIVGAEYILNMLPRGTHHYSQFIRPIELAQYLRDAQLDLIDLTGVHYNPCRHEARTTSSLAINYMGVASKSG